MNFIARLFSQASSPRVPRSVIADLVIDLSASRCGHTALGAPVSELDFFAEFLRKKAHFEDLSNGFDAGTEHGALDYVGLDLTSFPGKFQANGRDIKLTTSTTIEEITSCFGQPYWRDDDADETILFYEGGVGELQLEFTNNRNLSFITLTHTPLLADPAQRAAYGVTKPWPPQS